MRAQKSSTMFKKAAARGSGANLEGEVVNDDQFVLVMSITVAPADKEIVEETGSDVGPKEDVQAPSTSVLSQTMKAALTHEKRSTPVISDESVSDMDIAADEVNLLSVVHSRCKGLKNGQWNFDLPEATDKNVKAKFLKGLINVVPTRGAGDRPSRYCIGAFAVRMYSKLLDQRRQQYKRYYRNFIFLDQHDQAVMQPL